MPDYRILYPRSRVFGLPEATNRRRIGRSYPSLMGPEVLFSTTEAAPHTIIIIRVVRDAALVQPVQPMPYRNGGWGIFKLIPGRSSHNHARSIGKIVMSSQFRPFHQLFDKLVIPLHARKEPKSSRRERAFDRADANQLRILHLGPFFPLQRHFEDVARVRMSRNDVVVGFPTIELLVVHDIWAMGEQHIDRLFRHLTRIPGSELTRIDKNLSLKQAASEKYRVIAPALAHIRKVPNNKSESRPKRRDLSDTVQRLTTDQSLIERLRSRCDRFVLVLIRKKLRPQLNLFRFEHLQRMPDLSPIMGTSLGEQHVNISAVFVTWTHATLNFARGLQDIFFVIMVHAGVTAILAPVAPAISDIKLPDSLPHLFHFLFGVVLDALVRIAKGVPRASHDDET